MTVQCCVQHVSHMDPLERKAHHICWIDPTKAWVDAPSKYDELFSFGSIAMEVHVLSELTLSSWC